MQIKSVITGILFAFSLGAMAGQAATIFDISTSVALTDPTQAGRLSRNSIAQDWSGGEAFPGIVNTTTTYHYTTFTVNVGLNSFIQIDFDDVAGTASTFVAAYDGAYLPDSGPSPNLGFDTNWLGDAGSSGNFFGTDPLFFQVVIPVNHNLVVVVNNTAASNGGVGAAYHLTVEGYVDSSFDDAPEPSSLILLGGGLALLGVGARRRSFLRSRP